MTTVLAALCRWGVLHGRSRSDGPSGGVGLVVAVLIVPLLAGRS